MRTTIFLLALYGVFGFFACKPDESLAGEARRIPAGKKKGNLVTGSRVPQAMGLLLSGK